jgi:hypothetical protein
MPELTLPATMPASSLLFPSLLRTPSAVILASLHPGFFCTHWAFSILYS